MTASKASVQPPATRFGWGLVGWLALVAAVTWVVLIGGGYAGIEVGLLRQLNLAIITIGLAVWAVLAWRRPTWRPRSAIWPALLVPYVILIVATVASSLPRLGVDYLAWATLLIALYLMLVRMLALGFVRERIGGLMAILGLITSITYIGVVAARWLEWWELIGHLTPPMLRPAYAGLIVGGPTVVPVVIVLLMACAFAGLGVATRGRIVVLGVLSCTSLFAVFLSGGRGSWLALAVALAVVGGAVVVANRHWLGSLLADRRSRIILASGGVLLVAIGLVSTPTILGRLETSGDGGRAYYVTTAQRMFADSPLIGHGPGTWPALRIAYTQPGEPDIYVPHPHNIYALTLAETGLAGALAGAVALLSVVWLVVVGLSSEDASRRRWSVATLFVLIYMCIASLVDSYANLPVVLFLAALPVAYLDATSPRGITDRIWTVGKVARHRVGVLATMLLFLSVVVALVALFRIESLAAAHHRAVAAIEARDWEAALEDATVAASGDPDMIPYQVTYGIAAAANGEWESAESAFASAAAADDLPSSWINLAQAQLELGDRRTMHWPRSNVPSASMMTTHSPFWARPSSTTGCRWTTRLRPPWRGWWLPIPAWWRTRSGRPILSLDPASPRSTRPPCHELQTRGAWPCSLVTSSRRGLWLLSLVVHLLQSSSRHGPATLMPLLPWSSWHLTSQEGRRRRGRHVRSPTPGTRSRRVASAASSILGSKALACPGTRRASSVPTVSRPQERWA